MRFRLLLLIPLFITCTEKEIATDSLLGYLPANPTLILKINELGNLQNELNNSYFLQEIANTTTYSNALKKLELLNDFDESEDLTIGFYEIGRNNLEYVLIAESLEVFKNLDEEPNRGVETFTYENETIKKITLDGANYFILEIDGKFLIASSQILAENLIRAELPVAVEPTLEQLYTTSEKNNSATILLNLKESKSMANTMLANDMNIEISDFANWITLDVSNQKNNLHLTGVTVAQDSIKNFLNLFRGTLATNETMASITPRNANGLLSFRFGDFSTFKHNQKEFLDLGTETDTLLNTIDEIGIMSISDSKSVAIKSFGPSNLTQFLIDNSSNSTDYQGYEIRRFNLENFLKDQFRPIIKEFQANFYSVIDNNFIFSENQESLKTIIANKNSGTTFDKTQSYVQAKEFLPNESSIFFVSKNGAIVPLIGNFLANQVKEDLDSSSLDDFSIAGQIGVDGDIFHTQLIMNKIGVQRAASEVSPLLTVQLEADLAIDPQFVKNHRNNTYEIVVQDTDRNLYLIDAQGKILWKKQLEGIIRGKIHQVDLYRNGRLQMAFCTSNQFMVLDRNGEITKGIDKKYEGGNLNGLAVFDYENNRKYRMVVTQGRKIFMYDNDGKSVDGFTFKEAESPIIKAPKHFRIGGKDYLVFQLENGKLKIRHRAGGDRINVARTIDFSDNDVFLYLNKFSVTDKKGVLHQIGTDGKLGATAFNLGPNHGMFATSKTLALMDESVLNIKGKKVELDLGVYSKPRIFYIYDKIYVAVTDVQNQKIYLFDSQAESIPNFPVLGSALIDMVDVEGDGTLELVTKDQENSIVLYGIN